MIDPTNKSPTVFFFGVGGFGGIALESLVELGAHVVGVCTRSDKASITIGLKRTAKRLLHIPDFDQVIIDHFKGVPTPYAVARGNNLPIHDLSNLATQNFSDVVEQVQPELIVCAGFPKLIPASILKSAEIAALNFHPGLLPNRAGATPVRTAILENDKQAGLTVHHMSEHFDSGTSVFQERVKIEPYETLGSLELKISDLIPQAISEIVSDPRGMPRSKKMPKVKPQPKVANLTYSLDDDPKIISGKIRALQPRAAIPINLDGEKVAIWNHEVTKKGLEIHSIFDGIQIRPVPPRHL